MTLQNQFYFQGTTCDNLQKKIQNFSLDERTTISTVSLFALFISIHKIITRTSFHVTQLN